MTNKNAFDDDSYSQNWIYFYHPIFGEVKHLQLFVPTSRDTLSWVNESSKAAEAAAAAAAAAADKALLETASDAIESAAKAEPVLNHFDLVTRAAQMKKEREDKHANEVEEQRIELLDRFATDETLYLEHPGTRYQVHSVEAPMVLLNATRLRDKEDNKVFFADLKRRGAFRSLAHVSEEGFDHVFEVLKDSNPLFAEPITYVRNALALCIQRGAPQHFAPILLSGPPGLGKTHFTKALAKALGMACHEMAMDANVKSSAFLGQDKGWSNSTAGIVFEAVVSGDCANPIIMLDELEKTGPDGGNYQHPLASLHTLLEPVSSGSVTDISIGLQFDASLVNWIATCNHHMVLPRTLRSRFKVFQIEPANDPAVALQIAQVMLRETHALIAPEGFAAPSKRLAPLIAHFTPREQRQALEDAYADAVAAGRTALSDRDFADLVDQSAAKSDKPKYLH